jgi:peptidoglycan hydrolase CwlO-like protein
MHRTYELKTSLEHCRAWKRQLESQLSEFAGVGGDNSNQQEHQLKALQTDLENAQSNICSLQRQLDDLMD